MSFFASEVDDRCRRCLPSVILSEGRSPKSNDLFRLFIWPLRPSNILPDLEQTGFSRRRRRISDYFSVSKINEQIEVLRLRQDKLGSAQDDGAFKCEGRKPSLPQDNMAIP